MQNFESRPQLYKLHDWFLLSFRFRKNDHENYLCTLLLDNAHRRHAFVLRAFNVEVAKCSSNVGMTLVFVGRCSSLNVLFF